MTYEDYIKAINVLKATRKYIKYAHDEAEAKHDNYGEFYMDAELYEIMEETEKLLLEINTVITQFGTHNKSLHTDGQGRTVWDFTMFVFNSIF